MSTNLGCPKRMEFGPCGGVRPDGQCEMRPGECSFADVVPWSGHQSAARPGRAPLVLTLAASLGVHRRHVAAALQVLPGHELDPAVTEQEASRLAERQSSRIRGLLDDEALTGALLVLRRG